MEKIVNCKVKESRVLYSDSVRRLCIDNNWYTHGTSSDYKKLLDYVNEEQITAPAGAQQIAGGQGPTSQGEE